MRKQIEINNWKRKIAYNIFSNYEDPYTGIVTKIDVTNLVNYCKYYNISFYAAMSYYALSSLNEIDAFHYGYGKENGKQYIYKYEDLAVSVTTLNEDNELNFTRYIKFSNDFQQFINTFQKAIDDASNGEMYYKIPNLHGVKKVNITCIPWIPFSYFKGAIDYSEKNSKPKICWGKYYEDNNSYIIDISLLVNHAFQDGVHMGLFFNNLQNIINNIEIKNAIEKKEKIYVKKI